MRLLIILVFVSSTLKVEAQNKYNNITHNGNTIEFTKVPAPDTTIVVNVETGEEVIKISVPEPAPVNLNGRKIYHETEMDVMKKDGKDITYPGLTNTSIFEYLLNNLKDEVLKLNNGSYQIDISNIILDNNGKITYYDSHGVIGYVTPPIQDEVKKKINILMDTCHGDKPALVNKQPVPCMLQDIRFYFTIKNGKVESMY